MIYCTYSASDNTLLGLTETQPDLANGQRAITLGRGMPDLSREDWNPATLEFTAKPISVVTKYAYLTRFTQSERIAIRNAAMQSDVFRDYLELLASAEEIWLKDPSIIEALALLEQYGLIAAGRASEIVG